MGKLVNTDALYEHCHRICEDRCPRGGEGIWCVGDCIMEDVQLGIETLAKIESKREWITDRDPSEKGVYLVTILNREWVGKEIIQGAKPPKDEYWDYHANLYGRLTDGRYVKLATRGWHDGIWSGYQEIVLAWMPCPEPFVGKEGEK